MSGTLGDRNPAKLKVPPETNEAAPGVISAESRLMSAELESPILGLVGLHYKGSLLIQ